MKTTFIVALAAIALTITTASKADVIVGADYVEFDATAVIPGPFSEVAVKVDFLPLATSTSVDIPISSRSDILIGGEATGVLAGATSVTIQGLPNFPTTELTSQLIRIDVRSSLGEPITITSVTADFFSTAGLEELDQAIFTVQAVPELSTWAMMLIGLAGLGLAARLKIQLSKRLCRATMDRRRWRPDRYRA